MTETSPLATLGSPLPKHDGATPEEIVDMQVKQGRQVFGVELDLFGEDGERLPHDGKSVGELKVRGNWVISGYFKGEGGKVVDEDGWFGTGDVATIDPDGYVQLTDRLKDVIKSGGEWISSIEIENLAVSHPDVFEAAVIAIAASRVAGAAVADGASAGPAASRPRNRSWISCRRGSPNGGCRTTSFSSKPAAHRDRQAAEDRIARKIPRAPRSQWLRQRGEIAASNP